MTPNENRLPVALSLLLLLLLLFSPYQLKTSHRRSIFVLTFKILIYRRGLNISVEFDLESVFDLLLLGPPHLPPFFTFSLLVLFYCSPAPLFPVNPLHPLAPLLTFVFFICSSISLILSLSPPSLHLPLPLCLLPLPISPCTSFSFLLLTYPSSSHLLQPFVSLVSRRKSFCGDVTQLRLQSHQENVPNKQGWVKGQWVKGRAVNCCSKQDKYTLK